MNKVLMFDNPKDFLQHLKKALDNEGKLTKDDLVTLLKGSVSALEQLWTSQNILVGKLAETVDCLNSYDETWGHKLAKLYTVLECGQVTTEEMNKILQKEVCGD
jgi:hypothetical protein